MFSEFLYNLSIQTYNLGIHLLAPFHKKAKLWCDGRKNFETNLSMIQRQDYANLAWFHCASLGEFEQGRPVIEAFRKEFPSYKILLTFFSPSGYEVRKNFDGADYVHYLPIDTPENAYKFIEMTRPSIVFFVKYEFWRNYLSELQRQQIPVISFSTIFRPNQLFFKSYGGFYREILFKFNYILVQNQMSFNLLQSIDYKSVTLAGDTRFDRVKQIVEHKKRIEIIERFKDNKSLFIVGSAWQKDMEILIPFINLQPTIKFIIVPHEIHATEIEHWRKQISLKVIRFSEVTTTAQLGTGNAYQGIIIDNIGMLSSLYQYAEYAYVGGAFGKGLHNILEAATFGMPLFFGNKSYQRFQEATDLIKLHGAFSVANSEDISLVFNEFAKNETKRLQTAQICRNYVLENIGATEKVMQVVRNIL